MRRATPMLSWYLSEFSNRRILMWGGIHRSKPLRGRCKNACFCRHFSFGWPLASSDKLSPASGYCFWESPPPHDQAVNWHGRTKKLKTHKSKETKTKPSQAKRNQTKIIYLSIYLSISFLLLSSLAFLFPPPLLPLHLSLLLDNISTVSGETCSIDKLLVFFSTLNSLVQRLTKTMKELLICLISCFAGNCCLKTYRNWFNSFFKLTGICSDTNL